MINIADIYVRILSICHINIISGGEESALGALMNVRLFSLILNFLQSKNLKRVLPRVNKAHWTNPSQYVSWIQGNNIKQFGPRGNKVHWFHPPQFLKQSLTNNLQTICLRNTLNSL